MVARKWLLAFILSGAIAVGLVIIIIGVEFFVAWLIGFPSLPIYDALVPTMLTGISAILFGIALMIISIVYTVKRWRRLHRVARQEIRGG
jgi:uncharacterized membrane protein YhaH (DUF805 family)